MIENSNLNYSETLCQIDELKSLIEKLEENLLYQVQQDIIDEFRATKNNFLNWVEEAEFTVENYKK